MSSRACPLSQCDGTGYLERGERTVVPCACRNEAEPCPVPGCTRPVTVAASLCDEHWAAVPQRLRQELRRRERAWREGRISKDQLDEVRERAVSAARQEVMHL